MKFVTIIGARPQFVKSGMLTKALTGRHEEIVIHTGQHYDANMSDIFFEELEIPRPKYNLGIGSGPHGNMTGKMLSGIECILLEERPDAVIVLGDTNSTLAGALASVKLGIPSIHIEAGNVRGSLFNPEDVNRIASDHISHLLFACVPSAMEVLSREGLGRRAYFAGDSMLDAFLHYSGTTRLNDRPDLLVNGTSQHAVIPDGYIFMTCHRQENAGDDESLTQIFEATRELGMNAVYPVHPRNRERAHRVKVAGGYDNVLLLEPVGYLSSLALMNGAAKVITDSGGLQREAFFARKQCVTVFDYAWWPDTLHGGANRLASANAQDIAKKLSESCEWDDDYKPFGDGHACEKMVAITEKYDFSAVCL